MAPITKLTKKIETFLWTKKMSKGLGVDQIEVY